MRRAGPWLLLLLAAPACNGPVAAARDFVDPYKIAVGVGTGAGYRVSNLGLFETGLEFGVKPSAGALGWRYGRAYAFQPDKEGVHFSSDQTLIYETRSLIDADFATGGYKLARRSFALLPAVFTWVDSADRGRTVWDVPAEGSSYPGEHYLWTARTWRDERYAMIHAFDVETDIMLFAYIEFGYSIGEAVDFVTSLFGFDLAGDDDR
jgi:hypothetical protein